MGEVFFKRLGGLEQGEKERKIVSFNFFTGR